jgi:hypothetical protein
MDILLFFRSPLRGRFGVCCFGDSRNTTEVPEWMHIDMWPCKNSAQLTLYREGAAYCRREKKICWVSLLVADYRDRAF